MSRDIYTIGYSVLDLKSFIGYLQQHGITAIADIRPLPSNRFNTQFDRDQLSAALEAAGIQYLFLGRELGARCRDRSCYVNDKLQYGLVAQTPIFRSGLDHLIEMTRTCCVALVASEKDPVDSHRAILVARELVKLGHDVQHILVDGSAESHEHMLSRLINQLVLKNADCALFIAENSLEERAYACQAARIAHKRKARR